MGKQRNVYRVLMGKPEGRRPLGMTMEYGRVMLKWIKKK